MGHDGADALSTGFAALAIDDGGSHSAKTGKKEQLDDSECPGPRAEAALAGMGPVLEALREVIAWPQQYAAEGAVLGIRWPRGLLLHGPPGVGKTAAVHAVAREVGAPVHVVTAATLFGAYTGESERRLREAFAAAEKDAAAAGAAAGKVGGGRPVVLFLDEVDAICPRRGGGGGGSTGQHETRVVGQLLTLLDGAGAGRGAGAGHVAVVAATNRPNTLDPALRRPGRLDREVAVPVPDLAARRAILRLLTRQLPLGADVDLDRLAQQCHGYTGPDLAALCREAAMRSLAAAAEQLFAAGGGEVGGGGAQAQQDGLRLQHPQQVQPAQAHEGRGDGDGSSGESTAGAAPLNLAATSSGIPAATESRTAASEAWTVAGAKGAVEAAAKEAAVAGTAAANKQAGAAAGTAAAAGEGGQEAPPWEHAAVCAGDFEAALRRVGPSVARGAALDVAPVAWEDIGGLEGVKQKLRQAVEWPLQHADAFQRLGLTPPRGVLLHGPPGCSKTTLARAAATASGATFIALSGAQLYSMYVGEGEAALRDAFSRARLAAPSILFFDELDSIVGKRVEGQQASHDVSVRLLTTFLTEMDGLELATGLLVLAATNRPQAIDPALLRPGRFDLVLFVPPPDEAGRVAALKIHTRAMPLAPDVDLPALARDTPLYTGAELAGLCREAALAALREDFSGAREVAARHFEAARGAVRPSLTPELLHKYESWSRREKRSGFAAGPAPP
ncbi:hypothetical protein N2152v2_000748 [Parachlorella kessleri]